ncbi:MAG: TIM-barrel domain-containing protein [Phycisphaerales bacterium]
MLMPTTSPTSSARASQPQDSSTGAAAPNGGRGSGGQRFEPSPNPASVVTVGNARFTFLTARLVRMEWSPGGAFEDRASFAFVNRNLPTPALDVKREQGVTTVSTGALTLTYRDGSAFTEVGALKVTFTLDGKPVEWTPAAKPAGNLFGTVRTLDGVSGSCDLEPGLLSREGWALVDDSERLLFETAGTDWPWATPRKHVTDPKAPKALDWYLFAHGHDFAGALEDFTKVAGKIPLPPKYVLGSWWSRYWAYSDDELKDIVAQFNEHGVPLDVLVIDMDWHLDGWTGYTWNKDYFPDSAAFLKWCKDNNLFVTLNLHPADGVGKHEAQFPAFKAAMGITDKTCYRVPFDCTDRKFIENYFELLHHPEEAKGVDFWWMDWQQGTNTKIPGLDPLYWLNYLHWTDFERRSEQGLSLGGTSALPGTSALRADSSSGRASAPDGRAAELSSEESARRADVPGYGDKRPLIFSRWGGLGNHRYQIGFSGDTYNNWESLAFQPSFTATASNVGYAYWSHDIGGHQPGPVEPELYARWIQYGIFSPVLRTHCGKRPDAERRIWAFPDEVFEVCKRAFELRYAMIPYTYTACREAYDTGLGLCRPLYYAWPNLDEAYANPDQYLFGDDLMIAPVVSPANDVSGVASVDVWFPPVEGGWTDWATGRVFGKSVGQASSLPASSDGRLEACPNAHRLSYALRDIPVFARCGAVIPMQPPMRRTGEKPVDPLIFTAYDAGPRGADRGTGRVYEDDGITSGYERGEFSETRVTHALEGGVRSFEIHPVKGAFDGMLAERAYEVRMPFVLPPLKVKMGGVEAAITAAPGMGWWYDSSSATLFIRTARLKTSQSVRVDVELSKVDDSPIRAGLIGQLNVIDDVAALLGNHAPASLKNAADIRAALAADPAEAMRRAADMQAGWWSFIAEIAAGSASADLKQRAQARLLGLSCDVTIKGAGKGQIAAEAHVAFAPRFDHAGESTVLVEFASNPSELWKLSPSGVGVAPGAASPLAMGKGLTSGVVLASSGVPGAGELTTRVSIEARGTRITMSSSQSFCPSLNQWHVLGPFDASKHPDAILALNPIDETKPIDLTKTYPAATKGTGGAPLVPLVWKKVSRTLDAHDDPCKELFVDMHRAFGKHHDDALAYAVTWVECPTATKAVMALGSDDGAVVWVNGQEFFRKEVQRGYNAKDDRFPIVLKAGRNEILLKISQAKGAWGFGVFIEDEHGNPVPGVRVVD